jgi:hypothetical protein
MALMTLHISKEMTRDITNRDMVKDLMMQLMVKSYQCAEKLLLRLSPGQGAALSSAQFSDHGGFSAGNNGSHYL